MATEDYKDQMAQCNPHSVVAILNPNLPNHKVENFILNVAFISYNIPIETECYSVDYRKSYQRE